MSELVDTLWLDEETNEVKYIDQTKLPNELVIKSTINLDDMFTAIAKLEVRGAPAIGVFAALSMYVLGVRIGGATLGDYVKEYIRCSNHLESARPTAVNLSWALNEMIKELDRFTMHRFQCNYDSKSLFDIILDDTLRGNLAYVLKTKALHIWENDIQICKTIGENGIQFIHEGDGILTHCNAGRLATVRYGTATSPIYLAHEKGMQIKVFCDETRPLLQGARLTAYELMESGIDTTLQCDNMVASLMASGQINAVFVGCDRVAANGDVANKIGTNGLAIIAKHYNVPVYVCAPTSSIDMSIPTGEDIVIEQRNASEVTKMWYNNEMSHEKVKVYNPAFDVTSHELISAIITEKGVITGDYATELERIMEQLGGNNNERRKR